MANVSDKMYNVTLTQRVGPGRVELIEARNPVEARKFAEARFPGFKAGGCNTAR